MASPKEELHNIWGPYNMLDDATTLDAYSRDKSFAQPLKPHYVVKAQSAAQVQELVQ